ncbi:alpha/beta hydrolase, partial [Jatrophihabitans endophyticus]|uniref:alpha/beta hydrolase n=1 Tax=Jatrophihabitans endophyticus TaxID=1206085 RepID=UPI001A0068CA
MARRRASALVAAVAALTVGGTVAGTAGATGASAHPSAGAVRHSTLTFAACPAGTAATRGVYCAKLKVPLDYSDPHGKQITLTVSTIGDADAPRAMIVNPGGPGAPGIGTEALVWGSLPAKVARREQVFSFDPRGVGASSPISCGNLAEEAPLKPTPYTPRDAADIRRRKAQAKQIADACAAHTSKAMLRSMTVGTEARDMDRVRAAIGATRIDYLGYSAGTDLGATYESMFPTHVGRMVLDSVEDPTTTDYRSDDAQDTAFQTRSTQFFGWVAKRDKTFHLGASAAAVGRTWTAVRAELDAHPVDGKVGSAGLDDLLGGAMYAAYEWGSVAHLVTAYRHGHPADLLAAWKSAEQGQPDIGLLAYTCSDPGWPTSWSTWQRDTTRSAKKAPLYAWLNTWASAPCLYWPTRVSSVPEIGAGATPATLLLEPRYDPATPLRGAQRMHEALTDSALIVNGGGDHASYLIDKDPCVDSKAEAYWLTGVLPKDGTCPVPKGD